MRESRRSATPVAADSRLVRLATAGLRRALLALAAAESAAPEVVVRLSHGDHGDAVLAVRRPGAELPASLASRFFDPELIERPGGRRSALGAAVAGRIAELHGGSVELIDDRRLGVEARFSIPLAGE